MAKERSRERASELRKRAEIILAEDPQAIRTMVPADTQKLIHELNVHQIELEMQNAELRRVQLELQEARDKYLNLYDFAPTGYFTLDRNSLIVDVNLAGSELLGSEKHRLIGAQFTSSISPDSQDAFYFHYREVLKTGIKGNCELKMLKADGTPFHAQLISMAVPEKDGNINHCRTAVIDVTERKQAGEVLKESEMRYRDLYYNAPVAYYSIGTDGLIKESNKATQLLLGYSKEELLGKNRLELYAPESVAKAKVIFDKFKNGITIEDEEMIYLTKDGRKVYGLLSASFVFDEKGQVVFSRSVVKDVTERKRTEDELRESEEKLRLALNATQDGLWDWDIKTGKEFFSHRWCEIIGYTFDDPELPHSYDSWASRIHPEDYDNVMKSLSSHLEKGTVYDVDYRHLHKSGEYRWQNSRGQAIFDESGKPSRMVGCIRDITERKRIEKRWWDSMSNFYKVVDNNADGIIVTNRQGIVQFINQAAALLVGKKGEDFKGKQFGFPIKSGDTTEIDILRKPGDIVVAEMRMVETVWYDKFAHLISLHDITERKQAQQERERLSQQLQAKVSELEAFSYGIAHDLRSPLVSIEGFSRLLRDDMLNHDAEKVQEDIRLVESGVRKMQGFLNSTLEYSRAGHLIKRTKNVSFGKIVNEVITEHNGQISSIGATVSLADKFPRVYADRMRIIQVLTNLIQNSIKYRDKTVPLKIEIGYRLSEGEVVFFVRDNGLGIDASEAEKVFALFYRGTADGEGSGIGLAIVKKIIEAHGGRIWVQQGQSGKGTTMCFTLPKQSGTNKGGNNGKD